MSTDPEPQSESGDARNSGPSEPTDSEANSNNNNRTRRSSDPADRPRAGSLTGAGLVVGNSISLAPSPRLDEQRRLQARQRSGSDDSAYQSGSSPSGSADCVAPDNAKKGAPRKQATVGRHKSFPTSSKRLGKNTCRIRKTNSVKSTNKANSAISELVKPTADLEISSHGLTQETDTKWTIPNTPSKSMPVTIKPKSMQRTRSSPRQVELTGMLKNKPKHASKSRFQTLDPRT